MVGKEKETNEQVPVEGVVIAHELLENGAVRIVVVCADMQSIPRNVKIIW